MASGDVTAQQVDRLIERLGDLVGHLEADPAYVRKDVHERDLEIRDNKIAEQRADLDSVRAKLEKVVFLGVGGAVSVAVAIFTAYVLGARP